MPLETVVLLARDTACFHGVRDLQTRRALMKERRGGKRKKEDKDDNKHSDSKGARKGYTLWTTILVVYEAPEQCFQCTKEYERLHEQKE